MTVVLIALLPFAILLGVLGLERLERSLPDLAPHLPDLPELPELKLVPALVEEGAPALADAA